MRTGKGQKGRFDVREGMAFVMEDMENIKEDGMEINAGEHPWLVTAVDDDFVEVVMCRTLINDSAGKHNMRKLDFDDVTDLMNGCPPMDSPSKMTNAVVLHTATLLPKKELFTHKLRLLNENTRERNFLTEGRKSLCLSDKELNIVRKEINDYISQHKDSDIADPFHFMEAEDNLYKLMDGETVPKGFSEISYKRMFGWENLPKADPKAVYPSESRMHNYEKVNQKMLMAVRVRDSRYRPYQRGNNIELTDADVASIPMEPKGRAV